MGDLNSPSDTLDVMSQFMDVVTTFKCKGCELVCYKQDDLMNHIKSEHIAEQLETGCAESVVTRVDETCLKDGSGVEDTSSSLMATLVEGNETNRTLSNEYMEGNLQHISIQTYVNGAATDQVVIVDAGVDRASDDLFTASDSHHELFLCGQCNMGFQSIDDCKTHMIQVHSADASHLSTTKAAIGLHSTRVDVGTETNEVPFTNLVTPSAESQQNDTGIAGREEMPNGKVSTSTQVVKKKVGRKSKAELLELAKKENACSDQEPALASQPEDMTDINRDEEPADSTVTYIEIELPGKRKRRIPKHLTDSYYVPRKTKFMTNLEMSDSYRKSPSTSRSYSRMSRKHHHSKTIDAPFKCRKCRARFSTEDKLQYHTKTHSNEVDPKTQLLFFKCHEQVCTEGAPNFKTVYWADFKQHAWKIHQIDLGMITCDMCNYKTTVPSKLSIHKQIHSTEKPYSCHICHKAFKQQAQLKNHALIHVAGVDIREKESVSGRHWFVQAECDTCKRTFANQKSLQCHIEAVHEKIKPYACKFCGHTAARKAMMQLHMRTHTGEKPFKCTLCDYVTADHNSMRRHRMRHTGDKPYQCPHCHYACIQAVSLKLHLKSKHPGSDKCFSCHKCPYRSVNKTLFANHMRDHDMGLINESDLVPSSIDDGSIKLGAINDMTDGTANVTQLIFSALNAIASSLSDDGEPLPGNIETTVETIANTPEGLKAHKISFQIPATATKNAKTAEVVVQEQTAQPIIEEMDPLQAAALHSQIATETMDIDEDTIGRTVAQFESTSTGELVQLQQTHTNIRIQPSSHQTTVEENANTQSDSIQLDNADGTHVVEMTDNQNIQVVS